MIPQGRDLYWTLVRVISIVLVAGLVVLFAGKVWFAAVQPLVIQDACFRAAAERASAAGDIQVTTPVVATYLQVRNAHVGPCSTVLAGRAAATTELPYGVVSLELAPEALPRSLTSGEVVDLTQDDGFATHSLPGGSVLREQETSGRRSLAIDLRAGSVSVGRVAFDLQARSEPGWGPIQQASSSLPPWHFPAWPAVVALFGSAYGLGLMLWMLSIRAVAVVDSATQRALVSSLRRSWTFDELREDHSDSRTVEVMLASALARDYQPELIPPSLDAAVSNGRVRGSVATGRFVVTCPALDIAPLGSRELMASFFLAEGPESEHLARALAFRHQVRRGLMPGVASETALATLLETAAVVEGRPSPCAAAVVHVLDHRVVVGVLGPVQIWRNRGQGWEAVEVPSRGDRPSPCEFTLEHGEAALIGAWIDDGVLADLFLTPSLEDGQTRFRSVLGGQTGCLAIHIQADAAPETSLDTDSLTLLCSDSPTGRLLHSYAQVEGANWTSELGSFKSERLEMMLPASDAGLQRALDMVALFGRSSGLRPDREGALGLAMREALVNSIEHACGLNASRSVSVACSIRPHSRVGLENEDGGALGHPLTAALECELLERIASGRLESSPWALAEYQVPLPVSEMVDGVPQQVLAVLHEWWQAETDDYRKQALSQAAHVLISVTDEPEIAIWIDDQRSGVHIGRTSNPTRALNAGGLGEDAIRHATDRYMRLGASKTFLSMRLGLHRALARWADAVAGLSAEDRVTFAEILQVEPEELEVRVTAWTRRASKRVRPEDLGAGLRWWAAAFLRRLSSSVRWGDLPAEVWSLPVAALDRLKSGG